MQFLSHKNRLTAFFIFPGHFCFFLDGSELKASTALASIESTPGNKARRKALSTVHLIKKHTKAHIEIN